MGQPASHTTTRGAGGATHVAPERWQPAPERPLAPVIVLDDYRPAPRRARTGLPVLVLAVLTLTVAAVIGLGLVRTAGAETAVPPVAGQTVLAPGQTLWEVATEHAPAGDDPRAYLADIQRLNGFDGSSIPAWTVVLLPAR